MKVSIEVLEGGVVPAQAHPGDAGVDLHAAEQTVVEAGERMLVKTGIAIAVPVGYAAFVHPRSGLALREGITVLNTPGTIDAGYRGEIGVILFNTTDAPFQVRQGDRIAQLVFQRVETPVFDVVDRLDVTDRAEGGFGSTGVSQPTDLPVVGGRPGAGRTFIAEERQAEAERQAREEGVPVLNIQTLDQDDEIDPALTAERPAVSVEGPDAGDV